jgi:hypothetical protein
MIETLLVAGRRSPLCLPPAQPARGEIDTLQTQSGVDQPCGAAPAVALNGGSRALPAWSPG